MVVVAETMATIFDLYSVLVGWFWLGLGRWLVVGSDLTCKFGVDLEKTGNFCTLYGCKERRYCGLSTSEGRREKVS